MKKARKNIVFIVILNICSSLVSWSDIASATMETAEHILIDFKNADERENWQIINDVPPISPEQIQQVGFLISDQQAGKFRIEIDWIKAYR